MSDLKTVLINDSRIEDISGEISFAVQGGAQQNTYQPYTANTNSNSSHTWQLVMPSENIVIDRRFLIDTDATFVITVTNVPVGNSAFDWGNTDGFGPYPLNSCYLTQSAIINNNNLSVNTQDVMASLLRMNDQKIHTNYDGWTPSMVDDVYFNYSDAIGCNNNPLAGISNNSYDNKIRGRGCHPITSMTILHNITGGGTNASVISTNVADTWTITLTTHLTEPILFLSPFISNPCVANEAGFLGINNMTFNFVIDSQLRRVFRTANTSYTHTYSYGTTSSSGSGFNNLTMRLNYLSVQPSQYAKISARNILPLLQYNRYLPNGGSASIMAAATIDATSGLVTTGKQTLTSSNIALNQVPDTILIFARRPMSATTANNSDSFLAITNITINFNNVAGILSSANQQQLWELSRKAGSSQSFLEFTGKCNKKNVNGSISTIPSIGSILMLQPAYSFNLPEYLSGSSLGSYNLQFTVTIENNSFVYDPLFIPELVVVTITSGYMTTHQGTSQSFSGVLNKEMVMSAKDGSAVPRLASSDYERLVGGVRDNMGVMNMIKHFKKKHQTQAHPDTSGGVMSGGRLGKYIK
jgi:hypothetical protein